MVPLDTIADRQAGWSVTADNLKAEVDRSRWAVFAFSVLGALLATLASQMGWDKGATAVVPILRSPHLARNRRRALPRHRDLFHSAPAWRRACNTIGHDS